MSIFKPGDRVMTQKGDRFRQPEAKFDIWEVLHEGKPFRKYETVVCAKVFHCSLSLNDQLIRGYRVDPSKKKYYTSRFLAKNLIHFAGKLPTTSRF